MSQNIATPVGRLSFPSLNEPDFRFDDRGVYRADLIVEPEEAQAFKALVEQYADNNRATAYVRGGKPGAPASAPISVSINPQVDKDTKQETGMWLIRTKMAAFIKDIPSPPKIVDALKRQVNPAPKIGPGTKAILGVRIALSYVQGTLYATLQPKVVQILDLVEGFGNDPDDFGMKEMAGFVGPEEIETGDGQPRF